jgi:hypothetical protein
MDNSGIDIVGPLPTDVSMPVDITAFLSTSAKEAKNAKMLVDYLAWHEAASLYEDGRIYPAH